MASINYATREINCKIVYYGPGVSGKTTNLQVIHQKTPTKDRGEMMSLATEADRTLFFDFLPMDLGSIKGFSTKVQLYTVPGQAYYNATRKLVLRGVDGVVFVVDSQIEKLDENVESFLNLEENLREYGHSLDSIPVVLQYNKRDLPNIHPVDKLNTLVNQRNLPFFEATAFSGEGVFETLKAIGTAVIDKFNAKYAGSQGLRRGPGVSLPGTTPQPALEALMAHGGGPPSPFSPPGAGSSEHLSFPQPQAPGVSASAAPEHRSREDDGGGIVSTYKDMPKDGSFKPKPLLHPSEKKKGLFGGLFKK